MLNSSIEIIWLNFSARKSIDIISTIIFEYIYKYDQRTIQNQLMIIKLDFQKILQNDHLKHAVRQLPKNFKEIAQKSHVV